MQLAIVSDTHVPEREGSIPGEFRERIAAADHAVHAGDFETAEVLADVREFEGIRVLNPGTATGADPAEDATMMTADVEAGDVDVTVHEV